MPRRLLLAAALLPGCLTLHDSAGVPVDPAAAARLEPGRSTRSEALAELGPPTGHFDPDLLELVTGGAALQSPATPGRLDDEVLTWQQVDVEADVLFFPVLFLWAEMRVTSRTLTVFFDARGVVTHAAFREDLP
jgi:outer membrane protein assembly factor BamE (lipoprotein component of BamABCDE complex)